MRQYYIAGNWKMNKVKGEAVELAKGLVEALKDGKNKLRKINTATPATIIIKVDGDHALRRQTKYMGMRISADV